MRTERKRLVCDLKIILLAEARDIIYKYATREREWGGRDSVCVCVPATGPHGDDRCPIDKKGKGTRD